MTEIKGLRQIAPYVAGKQPADQKMIKLNTNENAYPPSPKVIEGLQAFDAKSLARYSSLDQAGLKSVLAQQLGVSSEQLIVGNGSDDILSQAFLAFFNSSLPVKFPAPLVKSSATSSLITRVPEVKLFGLAQTKYLRFYTCEVV